MKIGIDINGGDFAPHNVLEGSANFLKTLPQSHTLFAFGKEEQIKGWFGQNVPKNLEIVDCPDKIAMNAVPVKAIKSQPHSSISIGFQYLKSEKIDGFCSAGNTGAMLIGGVFFTGTVKENFKPCLVSNLPKYSGQDGIILDVGAIADSRPENLLDMAVLGNQYAKSILNIKEPKVGLLNIGEEKEKGNQLTLPAYEMLENCKSINFIGNVEGNDIFSSPVNVLVSGGFTGNIMVKMTEAFFDYAVKNGNAKDPFYSKFNYEQLGALPILGVNKPVVVAHGRSSAVAIESMLNLLVDIVDKDLNDKIKGAFANA